MVTTLLSEETCFEIYILFSSLFILWFGRLLLAQIRLCNHFFACLGSRLLGRGPARPLFLNPKDSLHLICCYLAVGDQCFTYASARLLCRLFCKAFSIIVKKL